MPNFKKGFSLVELLISLFVIFAILGVFIGVAGTYRHSRNTSLQTTASKIASCEIERLRTLGFSLLPATTPDDIDASCTVELAKLPNSSAVRTITDYEGNTNIKLVNIKVTWTEKEAQSDMQLETLISENGI